MKKAVVVVVLLVLLTVAFTSVSYASPPGHPEGKDFGQAVKEMATSEPGAVAAHVSGCNMNGGGMPALHELSGWEFGQAVKGLATSYPGAVADHHLVP